jgi:predicted transcriptional regulator
VVGVIREEEFALRDRLVPFTTEKASQLFGEWVSPDMVEKDYAGSRSKTAREIMVSGSGVIAEEARLSEALPSLQQGHSLLVVRGERPVGTLTRHDLLKLVSRDHRR